VARSPVVGGPSHGRPVGRDSATARGLVMVGPTAMGGPWVAVDPLAETLRLATDGQISPYEPVAVHGINARRP